MPAETMLAPHPTMLISLAPDVWHIQHRFSILGMPLSSRMTVVRLQNGGLWLHSPIPITLPLQAELQALGKVQYIVAPSKMHHLFAASALAAFPDAKLLGAPGLKKKRPDLSGMEELRNGVPAALQDDFAMLCISSVPIGNETVWLHHASKTLILTDLCQWWQGDLAWNTAFYGWLTGVRKQFAVPRTVKFATKDRAGLKQSAQQMLQWEFTRIICAHNAIIETDAKAMLQRAFAYLD